MATIITPRVRIKLQESKAQFSDASYNPTHFVALTAYGPYADTEVYTTIARFREVYGSETVPDGSVSNIERAIELGSRVRVFRVAANTSAGWSTAMVEAFEYIDTYQLVLSHVHQHLPTSYGEAYLTAIGLVNKFRDRILFVEIPKENITQASILAWKSSLQTTLGTEANSPYIAWFANGIKYLVDDGNDNSTAVDCDNIGTVAGLADNVMDGYGAWKPFSGIVRGIIKDGEGLVGPNPIHSNSTMQTYSDNKVNIFVLKTNKELGIYTKPTLWHNLTGYVPSNNLTSLCYIYNVRLLLYLEKTLLPILESYLEEPNTFSTWANMAIQGEKVLQELVIDGAIESATWEGDQNASKYDDLQVNNETDVRKGIYKVKVTVTEQILMQNINFELTLDNHNGNIIINDLI